MAIFFIATGPVLARFAQRTEWRAVRKQASLTPKIEITPQTETNTSQSHSSDGFGARRAPKRFDDSEPGGPNV
jgi:hypothetical protein